MRNKQAVQRLAAVMLSAGFMVAGAGCGQDGPEPWSEAKFLEYTENYGPGTVDSIGVEPDSETDRIDVAKGLCENEFADEGPQGWYDGKYRSTHELAFSVGDDHVDEMIDDEKAMIVAAAHTFCTEHAEEADGIR